LVDDGVAGADGDGVGDSLADGFGGGDVVPATVDAVVVVGAMDIGDGVIDFAGAVLDCGAGVAGELPVGGAAGGSVALGSRLSTFVFSRFSWLIRSCRRPVSFMACTVLLTSASWFWACAH
jgi:hypothetical protein